VYFEVQEHRQVYTCRKWPPCCCRKGQHVAKVFIATADGKPAMLVLPAPAQVDLDGARAVESQEARPRP
jgi:hypothetical protein